MSKRIDRRPVAVHTGFTLIELLVVVAIIALLISILLPSLQGARKQAKQLLCVSNLRSQGQAAGFYARANEGFVVRAEEDDMHFEASLFAGLGYTDIPVIDMNRDGDPRDVIWNAPRKYQQALRKIKLLQCPDFPEPDQVMDYVVNGFSFPYYRQPGDNPNDDGGGDENGPSSAQAPEVMFSKFDDLGVTVTAANRTAPRQMLRAAVSPSERQPSAKIYITEAHRKLPLPDDPRGGWGQFHDVFVFRHLPFASEPRISNDRRHPGGITALFFDGHAEVLPYSHIDSGFPRKFYDRMRLFTAFRKRQR